jgi:hypothetical protein
MAANARGKRVEIFIAGRPYSNVRRWVVAVQQREVPGTGAGLIMRRPIAGNRWVHWTAADPPQL